MGKDPAFLFYPNDYLGGTMGFSLDQHGAYLMLLIYQFNHGPFTIDQACSVVSALSFETIRHKFSVDNNGMMFNYRLKIEMDKRKEHSIKQRENAMKRWGKNDKVLSNKKIKAMQSHNIGIAVAMPLENENENRNEYKTSLKLDSRVKDKRLEREKFITPSFEEFRKFCKDHEHENIAKRAFEGYEAANWHDSQSKPVKNWKQKLIHVWFREDNKDQNINNDLFFERELK